MTYAVIFLSFWAEVHYNSIYPEEGKLTQQNAFNKTRVAIPNVEETVLSYCIIMFMLFFISRTAYVRESEKEEMVDDFKLRALLAMADSYIAPGGVSIGG